MLTWGKENTMGKRNNINQDMVDRGIRNQRMYIAMRQDGATQEQAQDDIGVTAGSHYERIYQIWLDQPEMVDKWFRDWQTNVPGAKSVVVNAREYTLPKQPAPEPAPEPAPMAMPNVTDMIDDLRVDLARWRGKAKAAYNLITDEEFGNTLEDFLENAIAVVEMLRKIRDLLDIEDKEDE